MVRIFSTISFACILCMTGMISAQGLFESAETSINDSSVGFDSPSQNLTINGYAKSALFGGQSTTDEPEFKSVYAELALKFNVKQATIGRAFVDLRLMAGQGTQRPISLDIREAWISVTPGIFDIRLGRQILSWGRADGINPTNNCTPMNQTALSAQYDDTRIGNELVTIAAATMPFTVQAVWIPVFRPDVMPLYGAAVPSTLTIADPVYPGFNPQNSSCALKLDLSLPEFDGSLSYFDGYETQPGFDYSLGATGISLVPTAYRIHAPGADFSSTIGPFGLRGEVAAKLPDLDHRDRVYVPNPHIQYIAGVDKTFGDWMVLVQYAGQYVIDFSALQQPVLTDPYNPLAQMVYAQQFAAYEIKKLNRLFTGTTDQVLHSITGTVQWNTLYETLHCELSGMYNVTTEEYAVNPKVSYEISDALGCTVGGRYLGGPAGGLHDMVSTVLNHAYLELVLSF